MTKATALVDVRRQLGPDIFADLVVWSVPKPLRGSTHSFKYRLAYVVNGVCILRYYNEAGKGDHKHFGGREVSYTFTSVDALLGDFWADVAGSQHGKRNGDV